MSSTLRSPTPPARQNLRAALWRGAVDAVAGRGDRARLNILIFHRVAAVPDPLFPHEMSAQRFDRLCAWLSSVFDVIPLAEAAQKLVAGTLPPRPLCITFDDGYADNHAQALPILLRYGLCATFFIATGFLDGGRMFNDTVIEAVRRARVPALDLGGIGGCAPGPITLSDDAHRVRCIDEALRGVKHLRPHDRDEATAELVRRCGSPTLPDDLMMTSAQVRGLRRAGMQLGAHTRMHPILASLDPQDMRNEIRDGRRDLESIIGAPVDAFAYPNGRPHADYDAACVQAVRDEGFRVAVSTAWGAAHRASDLLQLPRFTPWDHQPTRFAWRLLGHLRRRQRDLV